MTRARNAYAAPAWAAEQKCGDVGTKAVLLTLANYADEEFSCFPGQETIAEETEQSVRTVRRQLELLRELGLIRRIPRYNDRGKRTSDRYYLALDVTSTAEDVKAAKGRIEARKAAGEEQPETDEAPVLQDAAPVPSDSLPDNLTGRPNVTEPVRTSTDRDRDYRTDMADYRPNQHDYRPNPAPLPDTSDRGTPRELLERTPRENVEPGSLRSPAPTDPRSPETGVQEPVSGEQPTLDGAPMPSTREVNVAAKQIADGWIAAYEQRAGAELLASERKKVFQAVRNLAATALKDGCTETQIKWALMECAERIPTSKPWADALLRVRGGQPLAQPHRTQGQRQVYRDRDVWAGKTGTDPGSIDLDEMRGTYTDPRYATASA